MSDVYTTLSGRVFSLSELDADESGLFAEFERRFRHNTDWNEFENHWVAALSGLYDGRDIPRKESMQKPLWQIIQDMWARLAIQQGHVEPPDYRDELADLIGKEFGTRREFCRQTGISEQMLSHALAHRKHIHISRLVSALDKIGYRLSIAPAPIRRRARSPNGGPSRSKRDGAS